MTAPKSRAEVDQDALISHVVQKVQETIADTDASLVEQIARAVLTELTGMQTLAEGDVVGTRRMDAQTGAVATRIVRDGVPMWRVSPIEGDDHYDMQPTLDWNVVYQPPTDGS